MRRFSVWSLPVNKHKDAEVVEHLMETLGISRITAHLLVNRGYRDAEKARKFLHAGIEELGPAWALPGMYEAVDRICRAIYNNEKVLVYGDYDADGVCSTAMMVQGLQCLGLKPDYYLPSRFEEGYGLNDRAIRWAAGAGYNLLITVDCGISSVEEVNTAKSLGLDVIITDHHIPPELLPSAEAIVNPKLGVDQQGSSFELCGAGVVLQLLYALRDKFPQIDPAAWLDLAALATVADVVPLTGDNRLIVKAGIKMLEEGRRPGIRALLENTCLSGKELNAYHLGFILGPRINAAGRMGSAETALELMLTGDCNEAERLAAELNALNRERQETENAVFQEACAEAEICAERDDRVLVVSREDWHQGVLGIVASRLVENYHRPAFVISWEGDTGRGSGRSVPGVDMHRILAECKEVLERFGGHSLAGGLTLRKDRLEEFRGMVNEAAAAFDLRVQEWERADVDAEANISEITEQLIDEVKNLEPFGTGNPAPRLVLRRARICNPGRVGRDGEHFRFRVEDSGCSLEAIGFGLGDFSSEPFNDRLYDILFEPDLNHYNGQTRIQLKVYDLKPADVPDNPVILAGLHGEVEPNCVFKEMEQAMRKGLQAGKPVLVVYPTVRCLEKHLVGLNSVFPSSIMTVLHGRVPERTRQAGIQSFMQGKARVFLTTGAFFQYYINRLDFKPAYQGIALWPDSWLTEEYRGKWQFFVWDREMPCVIHTSDSGEGWLGTGRHLLYTNRRKTLNRLPDNVKIFIEADAADIRQRVQMRNYFMGEENALLVWDGACGGVLPAVSAEQMVLGDMPLGLYEVYNCLVQTREDLEQVRPGWPEDAHEFNHCYLRALCPPHRLVVSVYDALTRPRGELIIPDNGFPDLYRDFWGQEALNRLATQSILQILKELGLCDYALVQNKHYRVRISGSLSMAPELEASAFYQEGQRELHYFNDLIQWLSDRR